MPLPPAPPEEEAADACCASCGSLFHTTDGHPAPPGASLAGLVAPPPEFPPGYDPAEADRLIGRAPQA